LGACVQYITGADATIFSPLVARQRAEAQSQPELARGLASLRSGGSELLGLNTLFHSARLAEKLALLTTDSKPGSVASAAQANAVLDAAVSAIARREDGGAYLRASHTALAIATRLAYFMNLANTGGNPGYARRLAPFVAAAAKQVEERATTESPWYPGVMLRVALDTAAIRRKTPPEQPLDEQFDPEVGKSPGDTVEVEMTLYNWTDRPFGGRLSPVLPARWHAVPDAFDYTVEPLKFARFTTKVVVPAGVRSGVYPIGAETAYKDTIQRELHTYRVRIRG
jgi:hypothetical protein